MTLGIVPGYTVDMKNVSIVPVKCDYCKNQALYTTYLDGSSIGLPAKNVFMCDPCRKMFKFKVARVKVAR